MTEMLDTPMAGLLRSAEGQLFDEVDTIIERSVTAGDPIIALEYARGWQREGLLKGLAVAKMMYKLRQNWALFESAGVGDTFDNMVETYNGYAPATVAKYIRMWESIFENPQLDMELKHKLSGRPIKDLLLLSAAAQEGSLDEAAWRKVTVADGNSAVREIVRTARGEVTSSKNATTIMIQMRDGGRYPRGTIFVSKSGLAPEIIGSLDVDAISELAKAGVSTVINRTRMLEV